MLCFIYRSKRHDGAYLYIKTKNDFSSVPEELRKYFGTPIFVMNLLLTPNRKLATISLDELTQQLTENGYYFQLTTNIFDKVTQQNEKNAQ